MKQEDLFSRRELRARQYIGIPSKQNIKAYVRSKVAGYAMRQAARVERRRGVTQAAQISLFGDQLDVWLEEMQIPEIEGDKQR